MIIDSPIISGSYLSTGSLSQTGNVSITGSLTVTAGITGSIQNAVTASYASFALTSSYSLGGSGFPFSGSAVITGSLLVSGSQTLTGSLSTTGPITASSVLATGTITAQTLVVSTISSSVQYSSGSNIFGNSTANTQTFTGSVNITGSAVNLKDGIFSGSGANLFGIPATGITGLNLSQIASGSASASISPNNGLVVNTNTRISGSTQITGSLGVTGSFSVSGSTGTVFSSNADTLLISGSLLVTGSAQITGSLSVSGSITGSLLGTASFALDAATLTGTGSVGFTTTASFLAVSASYIALSASYNTFSGSASTRITTISSSQQDISASQQQISASLLTISRSYASTGSNTFVGLETITGSLIVTGSVAISTLVTSSGVRYVIADQNGLLSAQTASAAIFTTQQVTSTAGQTTFPITNGYSTGYVTVFVNGTKLSADEYVDTSGTNIVFLTGSNAGDNVEFQKYLPAAGVSNNTLRSTNYFTATTGQTNFSVNYTPGLIDIFYNGAKLDNTEYTAANGTSITLATASAAGDRLEVDVYSYQVGAFSGIGGTGAANQLAYFNTSNSITGSNAFTVSGSAIIITGSLIVSGSGTLINIGPTVFSGSVTSTAGFSGSFSGNADNATTASYAYTASSATNAFNSISSSYSYTASSAINAFSASKAISASYSDTASYANNFTVMGNLTVYGTQSVQYITSSQLNISSNIITVNVGTPAIRFGGISVYDSGSTAGATGSLFWDSQNNNWVYQQVTGSTYTGGMLISGPRNTGGLGNEEGTTNNSLMKGQGGDHVTSSAIFEVSGSVTMGNAITNRHAITGSVNITGSVTASLFSSINAQFNPYTSPGTLGTPVFQDAVLLGQTVNACKIQYGNSFIDNNGSWLRFVVNSNTATSTPINVMTLKYDGNVGIGITNPAYILDISGSGVRLKNSGGSADFLLDRASTSAGATSQYLTSGTLKWYTGLRGLANNNFYIFNNATSTNVLILDETTNVATFSSDIQGGGDLYFNKATRTTIYPTTTNQNLHIKANGSGVLQLNNDNTGNLTMCVGGGNVGILTASPLCNLDVAPGTASATLRVGSWVVMENVTTDQAMFGRNVTYNTIGGSSWRSINTGYSTGIRMMDDYGDGSIAFVTNGSTTGGTALSTWDTAGPKMVIRNGGNIGVGTTQPAELLHVYSAGTTGGNIRITDAGIANADWSILPSTGNTTAVYRLYNRPQARDVFNASPTGTITFNQYGAGSLSTNSSGVIAASDGRYKTKTRSITNALDAVMQLNPTYYRWNEDSEFHTEYEELGFIAQEVASVIPAASPEPEEEGKYKNYHDRAIIAVLTKAIQELQEKLQRNNIN